MVPGQVASPTGPAPAPSKFCTHVVQATGEDPAGSAWATPRYLAFELPLPWPYDMLVAKHAPPGLRDLVMDMYASGPNLGLIGIAPDDEYSTPGLTRLIDAWLPDPPGGRYRRAEYLVPTTSLVPVLRDLIHDPLARSAGGYRLPDADVRDLLVCTHGTIDICCATYGFPAFRILRQVTDSTRGQVRAWRCTHFGGHRFAPTALDLPEGRYWGMLQPKELARLVHRDRPVAELASLYRGWSALDDPIVQIAEREPLLAAGWDWCRYDVQAGSPQAVGADEGWTVEFRWSDPDTGQGGQCTVAVRPYGTVWTQHDSGDTEVVEQPQFVARLIDQLGDPLDPDTAATAPR